MSEQTYTRADMARAWEEGAEANESKRNRVVSDAAMMGVGPAGLDALARITRTLNPYKQEEA